MLTISLLQEFMLAHKPIDYSPSVVRDLPAPKEIKFQLDDVCKAYISQAEKNFDQLAGMHDLLVRLTLFTNEKTVVKLSQILHYEGYGKDYIKTFKASPDAWMQLVMQLAFHKVTWT